MDAHGIKGGYSDPEDKNTYFRALQNVDISQDGQKESVLQMLGEAVLNQLVVRVILDSPIDADTHMHAFVEKLRELPQCHFAKDK